MRTAAQFAAGLAAAAGCLTIMWGAARSMTLTGFVVWGTLAWLLGSILTAFGKMAIEEVTTRRERRRSRGRRSA